MFKIIVFLALFHASASEKSVRKLFDRINNETKTFNALAANIAWDLAVNPNDTEIPKREAEYQKKFLAWQRATCNKLKVLHQTTVLSKSQERQIFLLCRGPKFTIDEAREASKLLEKLQAIYADSEICIPDSRTATRDNLTSIEKVIMNYLSKARWPWRKEKIFLLNNEEGLEPDSGSLCLRGELDFNRLMRFSRNEDVLKWIWETWREVIAPMKEPYRQLVDIENQAAIRNGYSNIGDSWRADMEYPDLRKVCNQLYQSVKPLYKLLHGVTRYFLRREYGMMVSERGPIPAHLLGDMWAQNWEPLADLILPKTIDLTKEMQQAKVKWDVEHMLKRAEDFYLSLGLPAMTDAFWRESVFSRENHSMARCHGTAADMFKDGDFRILYCANVTFEDFYVIHHEMGHIQYFMAYEKQPAIFRQANSALQESIGDAIMYGVMTPQHLHRLGLIDDVILYNVENPILNLSGITFDVEDEYDSEERTVTPVEDMQSDIVVEEAPEITADDILLLKQALIKLPQIPFALAMEEYRWEYFEGGIDEQLANTEFWALIERLQGIVPPGERNDEYFDVGAKFHVPDNTPFVRYFLSSFYQHQLFESLCKAAVYGRRNVKEPIPRSIMVHRCDIYGSKTAGKLLRDIMSRGHSQPWRDILEATTGNPDVTATAIVRYYRPLTELLQRLVDKHRIPLGW
ncbi:angiotensin-converting enzyme-like [Epargyreus clarus]|uniref:angiotensin-converting enzyme-like n=1 Tax=Epargyreus clarus TaxID=520877 RepID=UPI003C2DA50B